MLYSINEGRYTKSMKTIECIFSSRYKNRANTMKKRCRANSTKQVAGFVTNGNTWKNNHLIRQYAELIPDLAIGHNLHSAMRTGYIIGNPMKMKERWIA